ncbi:MAG: hypothetical protein V8R10_02495 [Christensenellales bacterium]
MAYGSRQYPGFFTLHSLSFMQKEKSEGKLRMQHAWQHILDVLCFVLKQDAGIRQDAFTDDFTAEKLAICSVFPDDVRFAAGGLRSLRHSGNHPQASVLTAPAETRRLFHTQRFLKVLLIR